MINKKGLIKSLALTVTLGITISLFNITEFNVNAEEKKKNIIENDNYIIEKVSNPTTKQGEIDGITLGGDRNNSYAWAMAERNGYIYIGTNRNLIGGVCNDFVKALSGYGITEDKVWSVINVITNGEIPQYDSNATQPEIIRVDPKTGETKIVFKAEENTDMAYRMGIEYDGKLYFGSMSYNGTRVVMIDENDNAKVVYSDGGNSSLRASAIYKDKLYFGGLDNRITDNGSYNKLAVIEKGDDDYTWNRVADYNDFIDYASDTIYANAGGNVWDLIEYNNELYIFLATSNGFVVFKGHEATEKEEGNKYGWIWQEVIGKNSKYNMGMADSPSGSNGDNVPGLIDSAATPVVFNGKMYFGTFDHSLTSVMTAFKGLSQIVMSAENAPKLSEALRPMYNSLNSGQKMYCMDETGKIEKVDSINSIFEGTTNEYFWRYGVYGDKLYVGSYDSASLYYYFTKLTNGSITRMSKDEFKRQIQYIVELIKTFDKEGKLAETVEKVESLENSVTLLQKNVEESLEEYAEEDNVQDLIDALELAENNLDEIVNDNKNNNLSEADYVFLNQVKSMIENLIGKFDIEGLKMYCDISKKMNHNEYGFDLYVTEDGEKYTSITVNGFNDKYNYGARTLVPTEEGLYIGTANPFYGAQLWKLTDKTLSNDVTNPEDENQSSETETNGSKENIITNTSNKTTLNAKTGDEGNKKSIYIYTGIGVFCIIVIAGCIIVGRKNKK